MEADACGFRVSRNVQGVVCTQSPASSAEGDGGGCAAQVAQLEAQLGATKEGMEAHACVCAHPSTITKRGAPGGFKTLA